MNHSKLFSNCIRIIFISLLLFYASEAKSQISDGGEPVSFNYQNMLKSKQAGIQIPVEFSVEDLIAVDEWRVSQGGPLAVSTLIDTELDMDRCGQWLTLPGGEKIWRLQLQVKGAVALMLYYDRFYIPEGGKLFIYNVDKTHLLGAYTSRSNPIGKSFATEFVAGDDIILEYEPPLSGDKAHLSISQVGYGYNHLNISGNLRKTGPGTSASCMVNINCEEGEEWQDEKNGICQMVEKIGNAAYLCSGSLVNNTAKDMTPYILSAYHCAMDYDNDAIATADDLNQWVFYFHFEHTECENDSPVATQKTMTGCKRIVGIPTEGGSDGLLLLLNDMIPEDYNVYFNGWDRSDTPASSGVNIHHPSGDYMKISTFGNYPVKTVTWHDINGSTGLDKAHWNVTFDKTANGHAVTEGGSSGSPLFNENKQIVGTLTGGNSTCRLTTGSNIYGKLSYHWNKYSEADTARMDIWLDPENTGVVALSGLSQSGEEENTINYKSPTEVTAEIVSSNNILIRWKAPVYTQLTERNIQSTSTQLKQIPLVTGYNIYKDQAILASVSASESQYMDRNVVAGIHNYSVSALYDSNESKAVTADTEITVSIDKISDSSEVSISPTLFNDRIQLINHQLVKNLTVYSTDGKMVRKIDNPSEWINMGNLPQGVYFFKLVTNEKVETIRGIKQ